MPIAKRSPSAVPTVQPRRRGKPLTSAGPVAVVARKLGITVREIASRLGVSWSTVRSWDARGAVPGDVVTQLLSLAGPDKKRQNRLVKR
jgi:DNA-binding transcriptional regulator YiaG